MTSGSPSPAVASLVVLSVSTISAGTGYQYLTKEVVTGAEDYYVRGANEIGERPGQWMGSGIEDLGLSGTVRPEQMALMYGQGLHPDATGADPKALGAPFRRYKGIEQRLAEARAANPDMNDEDWAKLQHKIRTSGDRSAAAGFDLTFSPPKSWSVLWAAAPDETSRELIWAAHHEGVQAAVDYLEREACFSRVGHNGVRQVDGRGLIAARFDHRQSRNGDPQMHSHLAVLNRVLCPDGQYRALDGREIYAAAAAASGLYDAVRESRLEASLGVVHEFRKPGDTEREIVGVSAEVMRMFSSRRRQVEDDLAPRLAEYEARYGAPASAAIRAQLSEQATLSTRPAKRHGETVGEAFDRWDKQARKFTAEGGGLAREWSTAQQQRYSIGRDKVTPLDVVEAADRRLRDALGREPTEAQLAAETVRILVADADVSRQRAAVEGPHAVRRALLDGTLAAASSPERLAEMAVARVGEKKATWTRNDLAREVARLVPRRPAAPGDLAGEVDRLVDLALRPGAGTVPLTPPALVDTAPGLRRGRDGRSEYERHGAPRFATTEALAAEARLVLAARTGGAVTVAADVIDRHVVAGGLGADQAAASRQVLESGRLVDALVGPAGTGKTHATRAITGAWQEQGGTVLGLALSQNAAHVLGEAAGIPTQNIAKWLLTQVQAPTAGQLVIVDEAGMVPTAQLDQVVGRVVAAGGKVLLIGDPEQLSAPGAGGGMRLVVDDVGATRLDEVRRFRSPWEADASLQLRAGDPAGLAEYDRRARIVGGTAEEMEEAAYGAWLADTLRGKTSLLMAGTNEQAAALSSRARVDLIRLGRVDAAGLALADGNRAGVGDRIVTRRNDWGLSETGRAVANRDQWIVDAVSADGSLQVHRHGAPDRASDQVLPATYVAEHVELAYASTGHGAQGRTVDTGHAVLSERSSREGIYVAMTRGREGNWAYVACDVHPAQDQDRVLGDPVGTLAQVLTTDDTALAATQVLRNEHDRAESLHTLYPQWKDAVERHTRTRWAAAVHNTVDADLAARIQNAAAWPTLARHLAAIDAAGQDATAVLATAVTQRDLTNAADPAAVLDYRITWATTGGPCAPLAGAGATYVEATPDAGGVEEDPVLAYARHVAERMDARVDALAERALQDPPWWLQPLGPAPEDPADRLEWTARAGAVAAYRELAGIQGDVALGDRPGPLQPDSQVRWDTANHALHGRRPAADDISDEDLQAVVDRGDRLLAEAPPIVVEDLRWAEHQARAAETSASLQDLAGPEAVGVEPETACPLEDAVAAARADAAHLEHQHQARQDWLDEHGPDLAAARSAAAELARRQDDRQLRPFADLTDQELAKEIAEVEDDLSRLGQRMENRMANIDRWEQQAAGWDQEAEAVEWERPAWTRHTHDRQAEAAVAARLAELTDTIDRSAVRGGPRGRERAQLEAEAGRIRQANPALADSTDRNALWDQRGETAWATDKIAAQDLRTKAGDARSSATHARERLPRLTVTQQGLQDRLQQLRNESLIRPGDPAVPSGQAGRDFDRTRPKRSLSSTDANAGSGLTAVPPIVLEPDRRQPPQR
jgi:conjugative relaxase-like TrwC/TraI family protein